LLYRDLKAGTTSVAIALKNKVLRANFDDIQLYEGRGRGLLTIDANPAAPVIGANLAIDGVAAQPLLKDAADFDLVAGTAKLAIAIGAQGQSEAQLIATANGKADVTFSNGAIVGYNIPGAIRGVTQGRFSGFDKVAAEKTDFSELSASFSIANGIATNQDLRLVGPLMRVTGAGQIRLPDQTLDYTIKPKLVASLQGQGATDALSGLEVPVRFSGPWANPQIAPDVSGILKDPNKAIDAVKEIGKQIKEGGGKDIGAALKGLLGKGSDGQNGVDTNKAKDLLNKLFKKPAPQPQAQPQ
jgi:AsmA protein